MTDNYCNSYILNRIGSIKFKQEEACETKLITKLGIK